MVYLGAGEERGRVQSPESMAMGPERSKPLHNFTLPYLKWGYQRHLRCMKVDAGGDDESASEDRRSPMLKSDNSRKRQLDSEKQRSVGKDSVRRIKITKSRVEADEENGIGAMREKLMFDLKTEADKITDAILRKEVPPEENREEEERQQPTAPSEPATEVRPWNLRTRRAACKAPIEEKKPNHSPLKTEGDGKSPTLKGTSEKTEKVKFSVSLTRKEIEEDFLELAGHRPPRRPKKRARNVQKQLDSLFPGLWLSEITPDSYKVPEFAENGKR